MRKYEPIWNDIKKHGFARVKAAPKYHKTIIKAVKKEKYYDQVWKFNTSEKGNTYKLVITVTGEQLSFKLASCDAPTLDLL